MRLRTSGNTRQDIKFLFALRSGFIDAAAEPVYSNYYVHEPVQNLAYAAMLGHAIDLIGHGFMREAADPVKKIEDVFNERANAEKKDANSILSKVFGGEPFRAQAASYEQTAQHLKEIRERLDSATQSRGSRAFAPKPMVNIK